jgi:hypothetical protein
MNIYQLFDSARHFIVIYTYLLCIVNDQVTAVICLRGIYCTLPNDLSDDMHWFMIPGSLSLTYLMYSASVQQS